MMPSSEHSPEFGDDNRVEPPDPSDRGWRASLRLAGPLALVIVGVVIIAGTAYVDRQWRNGQVWSDALVAREGRPFWDDCIPIVTREIDAENVPPSVLMQELADTDLGKDLTHLLRLDLREHLVAVELPIEVWESLTASGRVPAPGTREVLAGPLCRLDSFTVDGEWFDVVGRLQPATSGFSFSYLTRSDGPGQRLFTENRGAYRGWVHPQGIRRLKDPSFRPDEKNTVMLVQGYTPVPFGRSLLAGAGVALVVIGGSLAQIRILRRLNDTVPFFCAILDRIDLHSRLFVGAHISCYGVYAAFGFLACLFPIANLRVLTVLTGLFTEGDLKHLGDAYIAGDVAGAAWATFVNNFYVQTLQLTILPSMIIPFWGVGKTLLSLAIAGFALSPIWSNMLSRFTYHSITVSLEIEAYVLAMFAVCLYPVLIARGIRQGTFAGALRDGLAVMGSATVLAGAMLALAAGYEAVTLILLEQFL